MLDLPSIKGREADSQLLRSPILHPRHDATLRHLNTIPALHVASSPSGTTAVPSAIRHHRVQQVLLDDHSATTTVATSPILAPARLVWHPQALREIRGLP